MQARVGANRLNCTVILIPVDERYLSYNYNGACEAWAGLRPMEQNNLSYDTGPVKSL